MPIVLFFSQTQAESILKSQIKMTKFTLSTFCLWIMGVIEVHIWTATSQRKHLKPYISCEGILKAKILNVIIYYSPSFLVVEGTSWL